MALNLRTKKLIYVALIVVIVLLAIFLGYGQYQQAAEKWKSTRLVQQEVQGLRQEVSDLRELQAELDRSAAEIASVEKALPPSLAMPELLTNLEAIAVRSEMTFNSVDVTGNKGTSGANVKKAAGTAIAGTGLKELPVTVSVTGGYNNLKVYLDSLERNLRLVDVQTISMESSGTYNIALNAYYVE